MTNNKTATQLLTLIAVLVAVVLLAWDIGIPFVRSEDSIRISLYARNILKYGVLETKLAPIDLNPSVDENLSQGRFMPSHISLVNVLVAISYRVFGFHEWAARLVPVLASLGTLLVVYILAATLWNSRIAAMTAAIMSLSPVLVINGRLVGSLYQVQLFFSMLALLLYILWFQRQKKRYLIGVFGALMLSMVSYWVGFLLPPFIAAHYLLFGQRRRFTFAAVVMAFSVIVGLSLMLYIGWLAPEQVAVWISDGLARAGFLSEGGLPPLSTWIAKLSWRTLVWHSPVAVLLSLFPLWHIGQRFRRKETDYVNGVLILLLLFGISPLVVFAQATWYHPPFLIYLAPFFAIAGALGMDRLLQAKFTSQYYKGLIIAVLSVALVLSSLLVIVVQSQYDTHEIVVWKELNELTSPDELVLVLDSEEFLPLRMRWYFNRPYIIIRDVQTLEQTLAQGSYPYALSVLASNPSPGQAALADYLRARFDTGLIPLGMQGGVLLAELEEGRMYRRTNSSLREFVAHLNVVEPEPSWGTRVTAAVREYQRVIETALGIRDPNWGRAGVEGH